MDDWRLTNQGKYMKDKLLMLKDYKERKTTVDHDHCEFCFTKISDNKHDLNKGYCTEDNYYWVCINCFNDFKEIFNWKTKE